MNAKILLLLCVLGFSYFARGQSTSPEVISTGGDFFSAGGNTLSVTIGEMATIETFSSGGSILTQGFQQPDITGVGITPVNFAAGDLSFYPNPTAGALHVSFLAPGNGNVSIRLYDAQGKLAVPQTYSVVTAGEFSVQLDLSAVANGLYQVVFCFTDEAGTLSQFAQTISVVH